METTRSMQIGHICNVMGQKPNEFSLIKLQFSADWLCTVELRSEGVETTISARGETAEDAVINGWKQFCRITSALPELTPAIEHRPTKPTFDPPTYDEIPF